VTQNWCSYVDGQWVDSGPVRELIDPSDEEVFGHAVDATPEVARAAIAAARKAFDDGPWRTFTPAARRSMLTEVAEELARRVGELGELERRNAGITVRLAGAMHVGLASAHLTHFAEMAEMAPVSTPLPGGEPPYTSMNQLIREPVGVCGAIVPWNAPLLMAVWKFGPALAMGNTLVLKPAPNTPVTALELARIIDESDIPTGVVNVVTGDGAVGHELVSSPSVDRLAFTGSTSVGRRILEAAASTFKRTTLELGGKSAMIVLDDCDLRFAIEGALFGILVAQGQACEAASRLLVPRAMYDDVIAGMVDRLERVVVGPTADPTSDLGPLISAEHRDRVHGYVELAQEEGAKIAYGGRPPAGLDRGFFYEPTLIVNAHNEMRVCQEEIFGPVLVVIPYDTEDDAIRIANATPYGLAAGIWTADVGRGLNVAKHIRAGTVWVNDYHALSVHAPFGGYRQSGIGRELGLEGLWSYTESKHVHVGLAPHDQRPFSIVVPPAP
jgi:acyl-CoA reductase-like NAD-dependent aldehyde dehydrogenase